LQFGQERVLPGIFVCADGIGSSLNSLEKNSNYLKREDLMIRM
jgi:hypothetical protein